MSRRPSWARAFNLAAPPLVRGIQKDERRTRLPARNITNSLNGFRGVAMSRSAARTAGAPKPSSSGRLELDRAATEIVAKYGALIMCDAVKHSASREDAEDAYQRALVILLDKAPSTDPTQLVPWLRVVVRNEAREIARVRARREVNFTPDSFDRLESTEPTPEEELEAGTEIEIGFEALGRLTNDQLRCLLAQAEGLEYTEIAERTGFSRRKVSRCLERGRISFSQRVDEIVAGSECERMQSLIHRVLNADADAAIELRPHLRHCLACRTRMREYEAAPRRVAALLPPAIALADSEQEGFFPGLASQWQGVLDALSVRLFGAERWVEMATAKKAVAIVALAGAAASSGVAVQKVTDRESHHAAPALPAAATVERSAPTSLLDEVHLPARRSNSHRKRKRRSMTSLKTPITHTVRPEAIRSPNTGGSVDDGSLEFAPESRSAR